jgi:geranylgeranyl transferase type-2 subunit alpha
VSLLEGELSLSTTALLKNPKCYSAWHHRLWVLQREASLREAELALCAQMLLKDARNFHCWNYRRAVAKLCNASPESEFAFTTSDTLTPTHARSRFSALKELWWAAAERADKS